MHMGLQSLTLRQLLVYSYIQISQTWHNTSTINCPHSTIYVINYICYQFANSSIQISGWCDDTILLPVCSKWISYRTRIKMKFRPSPPTAENWPLHTILDEAWQSKSVKLSLGLPWQLHCWWVCDPAKENDKKSRNRPVWFSTWCWPCIFGQAAKADKKKGMAGTGTANVKTCCCWLAR